MEVNFVLDEKIPFERLISAVKNLKENEVVIYNLGGGDSWSGMIMRTGNTEGYIDIFNEIGTPNYFENFNEFFNEMNRWGYLFIDFLRVVNKDTVELLCDYY